MTNGKTTSGQKSPPKIILEEKQNMNLVHAQSPFSYKGHFPAFCGCFGAAVFSEKPLIRLSLLDVLTDVWSTQNEPSVPFSQAYFLKAKIGEYREDGSSEWVPPTMLDFVILWETAP